MAASIASLNLGSDDDKPKPPTPKNPNFHDPTVRFVIEFTAGALGGAVSRTATAPIDRLRTVWQVKSVDSKDINLRKMWHYLISEGTWRSMWRGNWVNVLKTAPENAIRLATYEKLKHMLNEHKDLHFPGSGNSTFTDKFLCGGTAGLAATLVLYPLKTVKTLMNLGHTGEYLSINHCIQKTYLLHGFNGFYKGIVAHSAAIIPSAGIDLATYETLKKKYSKMMNKSEPNVGEKLILGSFSSCIGNLIVYPLIFARTRLQSNLNPSETTMSVLAYVWGRDGIRGVYRGFLLHIGKIGPAASISYVTFETVTKHFSLNSLS